MQETVQEKDTLLEVKNLKTYFFLDEGVVRAVDGVTFDPITVPNVNLWTATVSSGTYSFDLLDLVVEYQSNSFLLLSGAGTIYAPNLDATAGSWHLSANSGGTSFSFSSDTVSAPMPEPTGAVLFGVGLAVVGSALRRKRRL